MQDKLSREDFVLERFPDYLLHEMERKEFKEELENAKKEAEEKLEKEKIKAREKGLEEGIKEGIKEGKKEGKQEGKKEEREYIIKKMFEKGMSTKDISDLLDIDIDNINKIER